MTRQGYIRQQKALQMRLMRAFLPVIYRALQSQVKTAAEHVQTDGIEGAITWLRKEYHLNDQIGPAVERLWAVAARRAEQQFTVSKAVILPFSGFVRNVLDYLHAHLLDKVVLPISQTMVKVIERTLRTAQLEGMGIDETIRMLRDSPITKHRAKMIVRTESIRAMNYAQLVAADKSRFEMEKQWIAIEDKRTRATHGHAGVDGQRRDLWELFSNGLQCPGDPAGAAADVINCRCTLGYYPKRDLDGNLLIKPRAAVQA